MRKEHLHFLVCPECKENLEICEESYTEGLLISGLLVCVSCGSSYPIIEFIPRFVPPKNYTENFGFEWMKHSKTQYDNHWGSNLSEKRFFEETKWNRDLGNQVILEVGSGSGRFTEHAASTGAMVVTMDYSAAVNANYASNGMKENVLIVQADLYKMPFHENTFDKVFCIGVLQHTPDVEKAFFALPRYLKTGGDIAIDVYPKASWWKQMFKTKYWFRPFTKKMPNEKLYRLVTRYVNFMWPLSRLIGKLPKGYLINRMLLIANYQGLYNFQDEVMREWAILDSFDMLSPMYDSPQRIETVQKWFQNTGLEQVDVHYGYNGIEGRGKMENCKES